MARRTVTSNRRPKTPPANRYNRKTLMHDREYGFFWYAWLWKAIRPLLILTISVVIVLGIVTSGWNYVNGQFFMPVDVDDTQVREFAIESGTSITKIGDNLYDQGFIRNKGVFKYMVQFQELTNKIQYGSYPLSASMDVGQIINILAQGSAPNERTITIIPGWTIDDIANYLFQQKLVESVDGFKTLSNSKEQFELIVDALNADPLEGLRIDWETETVYEPRRDTITADSVQGRRYLLEGYLAPDTYRVYNDARPDSIIEKLLKQSESVYDLVFNNPPEFTVVVDEAGNQLDDQGNIITETPVLFETPLTRDQTIILASLIEKEAGKRDDYDKVSAVFHNRLLKDMRLESDASVAYAVGANRLILTGDELRTPSPYNTYLNPGLPIGPICTPSRAALQAALYPNMDYVYDEYLYFCATDPETGESYFSKTIDEHDAAVARYRPLWIEYDQRGGNAGS